MQCRQACAIGSVYGGMRLKIQTLRHSSNEPQGNKKRPMAMDRPPVSWRARRRELAHSHHRFNEAGWPPDSRPGSPLADKNARDAAPRSHIRRAPIEPSDFTGAALEQLEGWWHGIAACHGAAYSSQGCLKSNLCLHVALPHFSRTTPSGKWVVDVRS